MNNTNATDTSQQPCLLLELPAELRNSIYALALPRTPSGDYCVYVGEYKHFEPALLRTCSQIRSEASSIFYNLNFYLWIGHLELRPQPMYWLWNKANPDTITIENEGSFKWSALKPWLRWYHERGGRPVEFHSGNVNVMMLFKLVEEMGDVPWTKVERVLEVIRDGVEAVKLEFDDEDE